MRKNDTYSMIIWLVLLMVMFAASPVIAQSDDGKTTADETDAATDAATDGDEATAATTGEDETTAETTTDSEKLSPEETEPETEPEPEATDEDGGEASNPEGEPEGVEEEAKAFFSALGVRQLSAAAYPEYKIRGLKGGSLWNTFHGLQWPYMPDSGIGLSGFVWIDTGYEQIKREDPTQPTTKYLLQEGRFVLRVTPTFTKGRWFIQGQSEFVANKDQTISQPQVADVDDLWVRVGMWDLFDLQVGRYEAWELYHFGMGMDLNTLERRGATDTSGLNVPEVYGVTYTYYRPSGLGNVGAHIYPTKFFRFELLGQMGNQGGLNTGAFRGAGILDFGFVKVKGGGEYKKQKSQTGGFEERDQRGAGGTVQFIIDPYIEFGASGGWAISDHIDIRDNIDEEGSYITWSAGGFLNARIIEDLLIGGGANFTKLWDIHEDESGDVGEFSHLQAFGAIQYLLFDQLYLKVVGAWAKGHFAPSFTENLPYDNIMVSGRLRLQYNF